jgi:hypothetical protein
MNRWLLLSAFCTLAACAQDQELQGEATAPVTAAPQTSSAGADAGTRPAPTKTKDAGAPIVTTTGDASAEDATADSSFSLAACQNAGDPCCFGTVCGGGFALSDAGPGLVLECQNSNTPQAVCVASACGGEGDGCCPIVGTSGPGQCLAGFCIDPEQGTISQTGAGICETSPQPLVPQPASSCGSSGQRCCTAYGGTGTAQNPGQECAPGGTCVADDLGGTCSGGQWPSPVAPPTTGVCTNGETSCLGGPCESDDGEIFCNGNLTCVQDGTTTGTCKASGPCGGDQQPCCTSGALCATGFCLSQTNPPQISTDGVGECFSNLPPPPPPVAPCGYNGERCCTIYGQAGTPSDPGSYCSVNGTDLTGTGCTADSLGGTCSGVANPPGR